MAVHLKMKPQPYPGKWKKIQESLILNCLRGIPTSLGSKLRNSMYRHIFSSKGRIVSIQYGVEFIEPSCIKLGTDVRICRGVNIDASGHSNNLIYIANDVIFSYGVDIQALINTSIHIGKGTFIGPYVTIAGPGNVSIGNNCLIAAHSGIFANNHIYADTTKPIGSQGVTCRGITIEDDCWLGSGVKVLDRVTIGHGSVIGAGSVVTKNIPPFSIAVGVPAKVIKSRNQKELVNSTE